MWEVPLDWKTLHPSLNLNLNDESPYVMHNGAVHIGTQVRPFDYFDVFDVLAMSTSGYRGEPGDPSPPDPPQIWRPQLYNLEAQCTI